MNAFAEYVAFYNIRNNDKKVKQEYKNIEGIPILVKLLNRISTK